ncbi:MAG: hypothetical protein Q8K99_07135 [Actinomycetota bacterium]|nr:hypothetical protein [Actinomycetota bacterium]
MTQPGSARPKRPWYLHLAWVPAGAFLEFAVALVFSSWLHWPRRFFLIPYVGLGVALSYAFFRWNRLSIRRLLRHSWRMGLVGALVAGLAAVGVVIRQPASALAVGWRLPVDVLWSGTAYAAVDAVTLSVIPVLAVWQAFSAVGWVSKPAGRLAARAAGFAASLAVAAVYHAGFAQYRGPQVMGAVVGNAIFTASYVLTGSPLSPVLSHIAMHVAVVLRNPGTAIQLPPHY